MEGVAVCVAHFTVPLFGAHKIEASDVPYARLRLLPVRVTDTWQGDVEHVAVHAVGAELHGSVELSAHRPDEHSNSISDSKRQRCTTRL